MGAMLAGEVLRSEEQQQAAPCVLTYMEPEELRGSAVLRWPESGRPEPGPVPDRAGGAEAAVGALYRAQAVGLIRLAYLMLGDRDPVRDPAMMPWPVTWPELEAMAGTTLTARSVENFLDHEDPPKLRWRAELTRS